MYKHVLGLFATMQVPLHNVFVFGCAFLSLLFKNADKNYQPMKGASQAKFNPGTAAGYPLSSSS